MEKSIRKAIVLTLFALVFSVVPAQAQWAKAGKSAVKAAEKVISKNGSKAAKNAAKATSKSAAAKEAASHVSSSSKSSAVRAGAYVGSQHVTSSTCSNCSGKGYFYHNGKKYNCKDCNGTGKRITFK